MNLSRGLTRPLRTLKPAPPIRHLSTSTILPSSSSEPRALPRIASPSLWTSLIPKPLRRRPTPSTADAVPKPRNPYTIFIVLAIIVGSNAINTIALRNEMLNFNRKTDAKLDLLREVVQRVKAGEEVDVKALLGTGKEEEEWEWEEVMREVAGSDVVWEGKVKRDEKIVEEERARKEENERRREKREWWKEEREKRKEESRLKQEESGEKTSGERAKFIM